MINLLRKLLGLKKISGLEKVFINLCKGFDELKIDYVKNPTFNKILPGEPVIILGAGKYALQGYKQLNPIVAGIGLMTHPSEWPDLFEEYPVAKYLQHSQWANNVYIPYYGAGRCETWPAGIDTQKWAPDQTSIKKFDILIYNKIRWNHEQIYAELRDPILKHLDLLDLSYKEIIYGRYKETDYFSLLKQCRAMVFLCEHESQGFACCEALAMNVPVIAWNQGYCLDPNRFKWNDPDMIATSIPFFDDRCGISFADFEDFKNNINPFWDKVKDEKFNSRAYIMENLTLKKSAERMLEIVNNVY
ncbi:MAG: hypothetical protein JWR67_1039 [Mucilaginibacter sp.]|nr:hypothetical protein [Mucilaginibacter sp.]